MSAPLNNVKPIAYKCNRSSHNEKNQTGFYGTGVNRHLVDGCRLGADGTLDRAESECLVRATTVVSRQQLCSQVSHQSVGDVAGGNLRPGANRNRIYLGRSDGHEHHARLSARLALAAGCSRLSEAHRSFLDYRFAASHPPYVCALRFVLGPFTSSRPAASADPGTSQLRLGPESRSDSTCRRKPIFPPKSIRAGRSRSVRQG